MKFTCVIARSEMKFALPRSLLLAILITVRFTITAEAYGPLGHEIVGAIADERLAGTPTATKIAACSIGSAWKRPL